MSATAGSRSPGETLTPGQFQEQVVERLGLPAGQPLILVGAGRGARADGSAGAASALAKVSGGP